MLSIYEETNSSMVFHRNIEAEKLFKQENRTRRKIDIYSKMAFWTLVKGSKFVLI